jgi:hypothetical protein
MTEAVDTLLGYLRISLCANKMSTLGEHSSFKALYPAVSLTNDLLTCLGICTAGSTISCQIGGCIIKKFE